MNNRPTSWQLTLGCLVASVALAGCSSGATPPAPSAAGGGSSATATASASIASPSASPVASTPSAAPPVDPRGDKACDWLTPEQVAATLSMNAPPVNPGETTTHAPENPGDPTSVVCGLRATESANWVRIEVMTFDTPADASTWAANRYTSKNGCAPTKKAPGKAFYCTRTQDGGRAWGILVVEGATIQDFSVTRTPFTEGSMQDQMFALYKLVTFPT